jgi:hypothetical protein
MCLRLANDTVPHAFSFIRADRCYSILGEAVVEGQARMKDA